MADQVRSYIEEELPVSVLSKESYRERKAVAGQTLTALGKWWGESRSCWCALWCWGS